MAHILPVERVTTLDRATFARRYRSPAVGFAKPVVVEKPLFVPPVDLRALVAEYPAAQVSALTTGPTAAGELDSGGYAVEHLPFAEFAARVGQPFAPQPGSNRPGPRHYYLTTRIDQSFPSLMARCHGQGYWHDAVWSIHKLWWIESALNGVLHWDSSHNCFFQIEGEKRFMLASPLLFPWTSPQLPREPRQLNFSRMDLYSPRDTAGLPELFPLYEVNLRPGEMLFIPRFWLHQPWTAGRSVSVSIWFEPGLWGRTLDAVEHAAARFGFGHPSWQAGAHARVGHGGTAPESGMEAHT